MRRTLIIAALVIVLLGVGVATYFYFFTGSGITTAPGGNATLPTVGPGTGSGAGSAGANSVSTPVPISPRLVRISAGPVVLGEAVIDIPAKDASSTPEVSVAFIERRSGNVFSYLVRAGTLTRTNNKTVPGIQSASWLPNGTSAFVRYLSGDDSSTINTYALPADGSGGALAGKQGFFLPQNLSAIAVSSTSVLALASGVNGSAASLVRNDGSQTLELFTTPLSALRVSFAGRNQYLAFTKPSAILPGYAFIVDGTGHFSRIAGPHNGLVALASPLGTFVLVSYTLNGSLQMELVNVTAGETITLPVATIAEKCVWAADESTIYCGIPTSLSTTYAYPDDWYQGATALSDRIWKIDVSGRFAQLVLDFSAEAKTSLDTETPALNPSQTTLVFVNKNDGSLWGYQL